MAEQNAAHAESCSDFEDPVLVSKMSSVIHELYNKTLSQYRKDHPGAMDVDAQEEWFTIGVMTMLGIFADYLKRKEENNHS